MAPTTSKEALREELAQQAEKYRREADETVRLVGPLVFSIVAGGQLLNQSRPALVREITKGDTARAAELLATFAAMGGAAEFLLNPVIGRLSDRFGRRPLLLLSPITCTLLRAAVGAFPGSVRMIMLERMLSSAVVTGFFSTMRAMLNDKLTGEDYVIANGKMAVYAGMGVLLGPYLEALILKVSGARSNFFAVAMINTLVALVMYRSAPETLPLEQRKPVTLQDCSPFSFVKMIGVGSVNQRLMLILLLQSFGEGRILQDINMLNLRDNLQWKTTEIANFMAALGATVTIGGKTVKWSIKTFGMRGHTTVSNLAMALAFFIQGTRSKYFSQYAALALWLLGGRKRDCVESICTELTLENTDMGKGQVSSALSNFKSLGAIFGPPISARAYNYGHSIGQPGLPFWIIAALHIVAEGVHSSMSATAVGLEK